MRQTSVTLACLVLLILGGCGSEDNTSAVPKINLSEWQGSATYVARSGNTALLLCCRHVAEKPGNIVKVTWPATGEVHEGKVIEVRHDTNDYQSDLSFIVTDAPEGIEPVDIGKFDPDDAPFTCYGYRGDQFYMSVSRSATANGSLIQLSAPLEHGMSGGPCFNCNHVLVGVGVGSTDTWSVAADGAYLQALVDKYSQ